MIIVRYIAQNHLNFEIFHPTYVHNFGACNTVTVDIMIISNIMIITLMIYHNMEFLLLPIPTYKLSFSVSILSTCVETIQVPNMNYCLLVYYYST